MSEPLSVRIIMTTCSLKEARKKFSGDNCCYFIVDIGKIIRDLGYNTDDLTSESEFVINYSIRKKITQGIYSTRCEDILIVYKNITDGLVENLKYFLDHDFGEEVQYTIERL